MTTVVKLNNLVEVTVEAIFPLGFNFVTMHCTPKAAMDGMLEHGIHNFKQQGYMKLENSFSGSNEEYTSVGHHIEEYPEGFVVTDIRDRF